MFKPYAIVDESPDEITYEFKTIYLWILYAILAAGWLAFVRKNEMLGMAAGGCMVVYFITVSLPYRRLGAITRRAAMSGSVRYSGSKWSFKKPLRITVPRAVAGDSGAGGKDRVEGG
jgi:hypothetical protein